MRTDPGSSPDPVYSSGPDPSAERAPMVKVHITLVDDVVAGESVWATPLGEGTFRIESIPFFADACTLGDVVACVIDPVTGAREFTEVRDRRSTGHWQVLFTDEVDDADVRAVVTELQAAGGHVECGSGALYVVATVAPVGPGDVEAVLVAHQDRLDYADFHP